MKAWVEPDEKRLRPQEVALLALFDRMTVLEQAFTAERDQHQRTSKRLDHVQKDLNALRSRIDRLAGEHRAIFEALGKEA